MDAVCGINLKETNMTNNERTPTGNFIISENYAARRDASQPLFTLGAISSPSRDDRRSFSLRKVEYVKDGEVKTMLRGRAEAFTQDSSPRERVALSGADHSDKTQTAFGDFKVEAFEIVLFEQAENAKYPDGSKMHDLRGYYNPGSGELLQVKANYKLGDRKQLMVTGYTSQIRDKAMTELQGDLSEAVEAIKADVAPVAQAREGEQDLANGAATFAEAAGKRSRRGRGDDASR